MQAHGRHAGLLLAAVCVCAGCQNGPFGAAPKQTGVTGPPPAVTAQANSAAAAANSFAQQQQQALTAQVQELTRRIGQIDANNSDLTRQLAQTEQTRQQYQEQISLLQKQLGEASNRLRDQQTAKQEADRQLQALQASTKFRGGATITPNSSVRQALTPVSIPGVEVRQDGELIRIEIPADKLYTLNTAQLTADSYRILDEISASITRTYPRQRIVIEGHTDNSTGTPVSSHLLANAQAQVVFQQLTQRGRLPVRQLSILAMGENHPLASNGTPQGKAKNRRVEIVVYPDSYEG
jgi:flagellar motor protein MotB